VRWLRRKGSAVDDRSAADRLAAAQREVELSRQRLAETRETVVQPLKAYAAHNSFADLIAASLTGQHDRKTG
jgi:hypothetical protein